MWYIMPHTKTKIIAHVHAAHGHTGTRADFFFGMYQLETRFDRIKTKEGTKEAQQEHLSKAAALREHRSAM